MKQRTRSILKRVTVGLDGTVGALLRRVGVDTKAGYEFLYWKSRQREEGTLGNEFYRRVFTTRVGLTPEAYAGQRVLDVGCGPRGSLEWSADSPLRVGLDPLAHRYRSFGTAAHEMSYVAAGSEGIPFRTASFDVVTAINALDHVVDVERSLVEMVRVLRPGGMLLIVVDIHRRPTVAEPHTIPWDLGHQLHDRLGLPVDVEFEEHREKLPSGSTMTSPRFDHDDPTERYGVLVLRAIKRPVDHFSPAPASR